ncbi:septum formation inhibitor Maf [Lacinutrix neustonica]|uniref:septum formation inhibitor Maf n=1 Tax=Lacinutrix neustonica TaxID=2980107 RepID=UPI0028BD3248|nr:septum formation inhibitor Maf [Lacinutrix neustonica]
MKKTIAVFGVLALLLFQSCEKKGRAVFAENILKTTSTEKNSADTTAALNQVFKEYWYAGEAEISSYELQQMRYGEQRTGKAVLVYVTEPFLATAQVKANENTASNHLVLKLNSTKNFNTGIYPYSIMQSTFYPVSNNQHAIKVSCSVQEWCGHVYTQLNNRERFDIASHSYFEGEADEHFSIEKTPLENEIWTQLRINPQSLPLGDFKMIPALEYIRLKHITLKGYAAHGKIKDNNYTLTYP